jgi:hypothetical protein
MPLTVGLAKTLGHVSSPTHPGCPGASQDPVERLREIETPSGANSSHLFVVYFQRIKKGENLGKEKFLREVTESLFTPE